MARCLPLPYFTAALLPLWLALWPQSAAPKIYFEDVTVAAGLKLERVTTAEKRYLIETMGGGVACFDYDNDGRLDIYLTNTPTVDSFKKNQLPANRLYRNNGDGSFSDVTERAGVGLRAWSLGVSVADYDGDGDQDLYLTNFGANVLYRNDTKPGGDATFTDVTKQAGVGDPRWSSSSGWADYDGDGDLDLFVANYVEFDLAQLPEFGRGRYCIYKTFEVLCGPRGMRGAGDALYRNNGDGTFTDVAGAAGVADKPGAFGLGVAWSDLDDDGDQDLFVANDTQANYVYWNQGNGTFQEGGLLSGAALDANGKARAGMGVAVADYDRDGRFDLAVTNFADEAYAVLRNQGGGNFTDTALSVGVGKASLPYLGWAIFFADLDNDGWPDLFAANGHVYPQVDRADLNAKYQERCLVFQNIGGQNIGGQNTGGQKLGAQAQGARAASERDVRFVDVTDAAGASVNTRRAHRGAALGDFDNDGDLDLLLSDLDGQPVLLANRTAHAEGAGNYLRVRAPIGARVTIEAGGLKQTDEVRASGGYQSASEQVAHFGLGRVTVVERVAVRSSRGKTKTLTAVKTNQTITVKTP